ncbi:MAG: glycosyl hydrolase [Micromonosporaceae bacterium]|nr:glycosyl hydrolase [Micromonosporaceae bacterium]
MGTRVPRRLAVLVTALAVVVTGLPTAASAQQPGRPGTDQLRQVGYFTQWGIYGRQFFVKDLDTSGAAARLTHINYAFANVSEDGLCFEDNIPGEGDAWADYQWPVPAELSVDGVGDSFGEPLNGNFGQLLKLKQRHPHLKVNLSIGGWTWSTFFSNAALTPASRRAFVESCIDLFIEGNLPVLDGGSGGPGSAAGVFDGIDLDWEWPNWPGEPGNVIRPEDRKNFTKLLAEFRRQLDQHGRQTGEQYELTAFLPANPATMDAGFEGGQVFRYLDFATVQGYDFHGAWELTTNHQSAVREPVGAPVTPDFTLERTVESWLDRGAPRDKLVVGIPYFGRGWTGVTGGGTGLFQPATGAAPGTFEPGFEDYHVLRTLPDQGYALHRDPRAGHAWLFDGTTFWTFDDPQVVFQKARFIRTERLGGAMVWSLDGDDANATLTRKIHSGLRRG